MDRKIGAWFVRSALLAPVLGICGNARAQEAAKEPPPPTRSVATRSGPEAAGSSEWKFDYHGYFRAPMRVGIGKREVPAGWEVDGASNTTLHAPVIPDDQFLSFQSTPHNKRDWAELFVTIGLVWPMSRSESPT